MSLKTNNRKYLVLRSSGSPGLDHSLAVLKNAIKEAIYLNRTLVINKFSMSAKHNLEHHAENLEYKRYINLDKTQAYKTEQDGSLFHYIDAENFDLNKYSEKDILLLDRNIRLITEEENNRYEVIIRRTTDASYCKRYYDILVSFYPSDEVEHLTDAVLKSLGTNLTDAKKRSLVYQDVNFSDNRDIFYKKMLDNPLYYAALHVRGNDAYQLWSDYRYWNTTRHLKHIIGTSLPKGCRIYIMSDIYDHHYFDFLKKDYTIYRYFDFPSLEALVSKNNNCEIDNAMLYSVEKNILQYAYIKIVRAKHSPQIVYINSSFNVPLLSIPPKYLSSRYLCRQLLAILRKIPGIEWIKIAIRKIRKLMN